MRWSSLLASRSLFIMLQQRRKATAQASPSTTYSLSTSQVYDRKLGLMPSTQQSRSRRSEYSLAGETTDCGDGGTFLNLCTTFSQPLSIYQCSHDYCIFWIISRTNFIGWLVTLEPSYNFTDSHKRVRVSLDFADMSYFFTTTNLNSKHLLLEPF